MAIAHLDESLSKNEAIYTVAGFVASDEEWTFFCEEWANIMLPLSVESYHAADCDNGFGEFQNWTKQQRDDLTIKLVDTIRNRKVLGVGVATVIRQRDATRLTKSELIKLYIACFEHVIGCAVHQMAERWPNEQLSVIYDHQKGFVGAINDSRERMKADSSWQYAARLRTCRPSNRKETLPLQAADLAAREVSKGIYNQLFDKTRYARWAMYRLIDCPFYVGYCDEDEILAAVLQSSDADRESVPQVTSK